MRQGCPLIADLFDRFRLGQSREASGLLTVLRDACSQSGDQPQGAFRLPALIAHRECPTFPRCRGCTFGRSAGYTCVNSVSNQKSATRCREAVSNSLAIFLKPPRWPSKESGIEEPPPGDLEREEAIIRQAYDLLRTW